MTRAHIGIDPGRSGAACLLAADGRYLIHDWGGTEQALVFLQACQKGFEVEAVGLEYILNMGAVRKGWKATELLSANFGTWLGLVMGVFKYKPFMIKPKDWQRQIPPGMRGNGKDRSLSWVKHLYPDMLGHLSRKKDHNRAEAVLICLHTKELVRWHGKKESDIIN